MIADFAFLETKKRSCVSICGIRPPGRPFVPGSVVLGADEDGGFYRHAFACHAKDGERIRSPRVRIESGFGLADSIDRYATANGILRRLEEKMKGAVRQLPRALFLRLYGSARDCERAMETLEPPVVYHTADYLKGGFDKEYPDHLPPNAGYGTMAEVAEAFRHIRSLGHLVCPYTNPTWWGDHPRGETFRIVGESPIAIDENGRPHHDQYGTCDGWLVTLFHPEVKKANRKTIRQFTEQLPVDLVFQDQCGSRMWRWDFNGWSPTPASHTEGMLRMLEEDAGHVALGTEDGWDKTANAETAFFGCTWSLVPNKSRADWIPFFKDEFPADIWRIEPVSSRLMHDKVLYYLHDLGGFVSDDRTLAWVIALGYNISCDAHAAQVPADERKTAWLRRLQKIQAEAVAHYAGRKLTDFVHDRGPLFAAGGDPARPEDDGVVIATYGTTVVTVNLGDVTRQIRGRSYAPYGWRVTWSGGVADSSSYQLKFKPKKGKEQ